MLRAGARLVPQSVEIGRDEGLRGAIGGGIATRPQLGHRGDANQVPAAPAQEMRHCELRHGGETHDVDGDRVAIRRPGHVGIRFTHGGADHDQIGTAQCSEQRGEFSAGLIQGGEVQRTDLTIRADLRSQGRQPVEASCREAKTPTIGPEAPRQGLPNAGGGADDDGRARHGRRHPLLIVVDAAPAVGVGGAGRFVSGFGTEARLRTSPAPRPPAPAAWRRHASIAAPRPHGSCAAHRRPG